MKLLKLILIIFVGLVILYWVVRITLLGLFRLDEHIRYLSKEHKNKIRIKKEEKERLRVIRQSERDYYDLMQNAKKYVHKFTNSQFLKDVLDSIKVDNLICCIIIRSSEISIYSIDKVEGIFCDKDSYYGLGGVSIDDLMYKHNHILWNNQYHYPAKEKTVKFEELGYAPIDANFKTKSEKRGHGVLRWSKEGFDHIIAFSMAVCEELHQEFEVSITEPYVMDYYEYAVITGEIGLFDKRFFESVNKKELKSPI